MRTLQVVLLIAIASVAGALGGHWSASRETRHPEVVVLDFPAWSAAIGADSIGSADALRQAAEDRGRLMRERIEEFRRAGIVVLDSSVVVAAPEARYVRPE